MDNLMSLDDNTADGGELVCEARLASTRRVSPFNET